MDIQGAIDDAMNTQGLIPGDPMGDDDGEIAVIQPADPMELIKLDSNIPVIPGTDIVEDYKSARSILHSLTKVNAQAIGEAMRMVQEVQHPRSIEVLSQLLQNMRGLSKDIILLQKEFVKTMGELDNLQNPEPEEEESGGTNIQNNTVNNFHGTTEDMMKMIEDRMKKQDELKGD